MLWVLFIQKQTGKYFSLEVPLYRQPKRWENRTEGFYLILKKALNRIVENHFLAMWSASTLFSIEKGQWKFIRTTISLHPGFYLFQCLLLSINLNWFLPAGENSRCSTVNVNMLNQWKLWELSRELIRGRHVHFGKNQTCILSSITICSTSLHQL